MFDLPVHASSEGIQKKKVEEETETLTSSIEDIEVKDHVEVVPVTEITEEGIKRYSLDDYQEMEDMLNEAKPEDAEIEDEEIVFEKRVVDAPEEEAAAGDDEPADPLNAPISKILKDRTEERKRKMKEFNYKFRNSASKIDDIEKRTGLQADGDFAR